MVRGTVSGCTFLIAWLLIALLVGHASAEPDRQFAAGYKAGTGLGPFGASASAKVTPRFTFDLTLFALHRDGQWGVGLAPAVQWNLLRRPRWSPFLALGMQYVRQRFGEGFSAGGFGGYGTVGYEFNLDNGISIQLGVGWHGLEHLEAQRGLVSVTQPAIFGSHYELGLRYWF